MTKEELEAQVMGIYKILTHQGLAGLNDHQVYALLAWHFWKDGMDWDLGVEDIASGQYLPFNTRESAIRQLREVFGIKI